MYHLLYAFGIGSVITGVLTYLVLRYFHENECLELDKKCDVALQREEATAKDLIKSEVQLLEMSKRVSELTLDNHVLNLRISNALDCITPHCAHIGTRMARALRGQQVNPNVNVTIIDGPPLRIKPERYVTVTDA